MSIVSLALAKSHLKIDGNAEDELIELYLDAAEAWLANYIGKPLADLDPLPADLKLALLKLAAFNFEQRSVASFGLAVTLTPLSVTSIADAYRESWFHAD